MSQLVKFSGLKELLSSIGHKVGWVDEADFRYLNLVPAYDVSINSILAGTHVPAHTHDQTVVNGVLEGSCIVGPQDDPLPLGPGDWVLIPKETSHFLKVESDTILLELWEK